MILQIMQLIQLSYAIGLEKPTSIYVYKADGRNKVIDLSEMITKTIDSTPLRNWSIDSICLAIDLDRHTKLDGHLGKSLSSMARNKFNY